MLNLRPGWGCGEVGHRAGASECKAGKTQFHSSAPDWFKSERQSKGGKGKGGKGKGGKAEEAAEDTLQKVVKAAKAKAVEKGRETKGYVSTSTTEMGIAGSGQTAISVTTSSQRYSWDQQTKEVAQSQTRRRRKGRKCTRQPWWPS